MADETLTWIAVDGVQTPLDGSAGYLALVGRQGFYAPPISLIANQIPLQPGVREKYVQTLPNIVRVPMLIQPTTEAVLAANRRALKWAMNPRRGVGTLRSQAADGVTRDLFCRLIAGFEGNESEQLRGPGWAEIDGEFQASDPYWYDAVAKTQVFTAGAPTLFFTNPFLPLNLSSSGILSGFTISNDGDVECWPVWTITGPGSAITLANATTGESLTSSIGLSAGQVLTIDTRPGVKTVTREDGSNQFATISATSSLWALAVGPNNISLSMSGSTTASSLQLSYKQRYEGV